ncbi:MULTISPECIES: sugar phosphate isomerase/epimerase family protein [Phyllobacteriaceae]|nr:MULTISPECIES: sugar phosphate isomerase/epimerase [Mesorhizobium]MBN9234031.1 sugar phosphate isomerase/epimerase [Mesorhizobium sp.]MDQ0331563.1 sugar phosphate isomerase/epimerase [Mesorhizobium sp. YL-MeA3-2017]
MSKTVNSYLMPFSNVAHLPLAEKFEATRIAGYDALSLMPYEVDQLEVAGISPKEVRRRADDAGMRILRLDPLNTWSRVWLPDNMDDAYIATVDTRQERVFALCAELGCRSISLNATFPLGSMPMDAIIEDYAKICAASARFDLDCSLEFIPLWGVPTLAMAWQVVEGAGAKNGGLVFDTWHCVRGKSNLADLRKIPGDKIHCVQLNDGPLELPAGVTIKDDCYDRKFPGDGQFPNVEIVRVLTETGGLNQVGAEVFSPMLKAMSAREVGEISRMSVEEVLRLALS